MTLRISVSLCGFFWRTFASFCLAVNHQSTYYFYMSGRFYRFTVSTESATVSNSVASRVKPSDNVAICKKTNILGGGLGYAYECTLFTVSLFSLFTIPVNHLRLNWHSQTRRNCRRQRRELGKSLYPACCTTGDDWSYKYKATSLITASLNYRSLFVLFRMH